MRKGTVTRGFVCALLFVTLQRANGQQSSSASKPGTPSTTSSAQQTGQKIGTIVSSAVDTAFPIVGKIMDLFKGNKKNASKDEVSNATDDVQKQFLATVKQKIQPAATVAKELGIMETFATAAVNANDNIVTINALLAQSTPDYEQVDTEWTIAKNYLADVLVIKETDLQVVSEKSIQLRLIDLQNTRRDLMVRIDRNIALGKARKPMKKSDLQLQMLAMGAVLKSINSLTALEFMSLQSDMDALSKWANGAAGGEMERKPNAHLLQILDESAAIGSETLASTSIPQM